MLYRYSYVTICIVSLMEHARFVYATHRASTRVLTLLLLALKLYDASDIHDV